MLYGEKDFAGVRKMLTNVIKIALTLIIFFVAFILISPQTILSIFAPSLIGVAFFTS